MMASNILSRLLPSASDEPSMYGPLRGQHRRTASSDSGGHTGMDIDEENLGERFQDQDLDHLLADAAESQLTTESTAFLSKDKPRSTSHQRNTSHARPKRMGSVPANAGSSGHDDDDDVPESLLLEGHRDHGTEAPIRRTSTNNGDLLPPPVPGPSSRHARAQWDTTRLHQRLHRDDQGRRPVQRSAAVLSNDPKEQALWLWANVQDLDGFLNEVYTYFKGHGIWSIGLKRLLILLQTAFAVIFSTFLMFCVEYKLIPQKTSLKDVLVDKCTQKMNGFWVLLLWLFAFGWFYHLMKYTIEIRRLWQLHNFYHYLLDIPDRDIQTVSWPQVVSRLMTLRDGNLSTAENISAADRRTLKYQSKQRMDAHDIANRIMRRDNYLIALFNKDILDLTIPIPFLGSRQFFSRTTEWHVYAAILDFVFDEKGQVKTAFLSSAKRADLIMTLRRRLFYAGLLSVIISPFAAVIYIVSYFLRYFTEYHKDPSQLGSRTFTPLAQWKFRQFNELPHLFERRRNMAYPYADQYLEQFPKDKMDQLYSFIAFVSGSLASVLIIATLFDSELFLGFEITSGRTSFFYIGILTAIFQVTRKSLSAPPGELAMDPEFALINVIECTGYYPASWENRLHTDEVRQEFSSLYQLKLVIFVEEVLSMILTPFIFMTRLTECSERIIDFFREFTIHVDGVGHVCSFAVFDFMKAGENVATNKAMQAGLREGYFKDENKKALASYYGFMEAYGGNPSRSGNRGRGMAAHSFFPPPAFPNPVRGTSADPGMRGTSRGPMGRQSMHRTPRHGPATGRGSPIHSVLLDPHHQPSMAGPRNSPRQTAQSRFRGTRQPIRDPDELEEEEGHAGPSVPLHDLTTSKIMEEDSHLGDSWRTQQPAQEDKEDEEKPAGVLGLIHQFSKAQTEGRGVGLAL